MKRFEVFCVAIVALAVLSLFAWSKLGDLGYTEEEWKAASEKVERESQSAPVAATSAKTKVETKSLLKKESNVISKRLKLELPAHWEDVTHLHEDATFSYRSKLANSTDLLQILIAEYKGGKEPRPSEADLIDLALEAGKENHWGKPEKTFSGPSTLGSFGSAVFIPENKAPVRYYQVWFLSNGLDLIYVIYKSSSSVGADQLREVQAIAEHLDFR